MLTPEELDAEMSHAGHTDVEFAVKLQAALASVRIFVGTCNLGGPPTQS